MTISDPANPAARSLTGDVLYAVRYYLGGRAGVIALAAAALGLGAYANWGWLVAAGIAPLLLTLAPCAAMCALGLCMGRKSESGSGEAASSPSPEEVFHAKSTPRLAAAPGENQEEIPVSNQPAQENPSNRKVCC